MAPKSAGTVFTGILFSVCLAACLHDDSDDSGNTPGDENEAGIQLERIFPDLAFSQPVGLIPHPFDEEIWYLLEQSGRIYRLDASTGALGTLVNLAAFYPLSTCNECGLLGMAFDPNFVGNGFIYLSFMENVAGQNVSFVSAFVSADHGLTLATSSGAQLTRDDLIEVEQPYTNHNGGHIAFGPDNFLYFGLGDGGSSNDPDNNAQDLSTPLGSMLRIATNGDPAPGNPFINDPGADPRIYAYGLRNPWRWSFDRQTGELWLGDVGQNRAEEIDIIVSGGNYGWRCREGFQETANACTTSGPYIDPVAEYGRDEGISVTGGYVYRGETMAGLEGVYIFGDFGTGNIWGLFPQADDNGYERRLLMNSDLSISSFAEDADGELIVLDYGSGE
ncbi:MAG TPA: PQQ-dependent sugar dehydrogenase, partial [Gammaproteobacteria bacterium]